MLSIPILTHPNCPYSIPPNSGMNSSARCSSIRRAPPPSGLQETGTHPETVGRLTRRFAQQGMLGLVPESLDVHPAERQLRVPESVVHAPSGSRALHRIGARELARIIFHTTMHRLTSQTARRLWERLPPAPPPVRLR